MSYMDELAESIAAIVERVYSHGLEVGAGEVAPSKSLVVAAVAELLVETLSTATVAESALNGEDGWREVAAGATKGAYFLLVSNARDDRAFAKFLRYSVLDGVADAEEVLTLVRSELEMRKAIRLGPEPPAT